MKVAVFIDAENISAQYAKQILSTASDYGDVIIKRAFADWSSPAMKSWNDNISSLALKQEQQRAAVKGKNASDISLTVNALIALFEKNIDVFCLASSDSDYTGLVQELRERGKVIVGFGTTHQTTDVFVNSFTEFIYLDKEKETVNKLSKDRIEVLRNIIEALIEQNGKAFCSNIGKEMRNKYSDFIPKNFGYKGVNDLIKSNLAAIGNYVVEVGPDGNTLYLVRA